MSGPISQTQHEVLVEKVNRVEVGLMELKGEQKLLNERLDSTNGNLDKLIYRLDKDADEAAKDRKTRQEERRADRKWIIGTFMATVGILIAIARFFF